VEKKGEPPKGGRGYSKRQTPIKEFANVEKKGEPPKGGRGWSGDEFQSRNPKERKEGRRSRAMVKLATGK
jgi:hypothetical protein